MRIQVTKTDIIAGDRRNCSLCPIARALKRIYGRSFLVSKYNVMDEATEDWYSLPRDAIMFIENYDEKNHAYPFEFEFNGPNEAKEVEIAI